MTRGLGSAFLEQTARNLEATGKEREYLQALETSLVVRKAILRRCGGLGRAAVRVLDAVRGRWLCVHMGWFMTTEAVGSQPVKPGSSQPASKPAMLPRSIP